MLSRKRALAGGLAAVSVVAGIVACTVYEQEVTVNVCDVRQLPQDSECFHAYYGVDETLIPHEPFVPDALLMVQRKLLVSTRVCEPDSATGVPVGADLYVVRPKTKLGNLVTSHSRVYNVERALCSAKDESGTTRPTLWGIDVQLEKPGPVVQLDAHQGHDESQVVRATFTSEAPNSYQHLLTPSTVAWPTPHPVGSLEWVLQTYDLNAQRWVDVRSMQSPNDHEFTGELTASVPGNTGVRLELRSKVATSVRIMDARIFVPICVRDPTSGKCQ